MSWATLDDGFADHPKVLPISSDAFRLHVCAMCWCNRRGTDGAVVTRDLRILAGMIPGEPVMAELVAELVAERLWDVTEAGWQLHDFLKWNKPAAKVKAEREAHAQRQKEARDRAKEAAHAKARDAARDAARASSRAPSPSHPIPSSCSKEQDPPKSPKGPDTGEFKAKPQAQPELSAVHAWEAIQKGAGGPQALGLARNYGQLNGTWLDDNKAALWVRNWSALQALERPPTLELCEKLGRWLVAGQKPIPAPWQCLAKGGNHANVGAWFDQAEQWDGTSDPRARPTSARAPAQLPQSQQPQRVYAETTAKRQADAIERGELPEVDPAIVAAELRKMQEATS